MKYRKRILSLLSGCTSILLVACSSTGGTDGSHSSERQLSPGATVELTQPINFPYRANRVFIQGGQILARRRDAIRFQPFCSFGLNRNRDNNPQISEINPDVFSVQGTRTWVTASREIDQPVQVASNSAFEGSDELLIAFRGGGGVSRFTYHTEISLNSEQQPQVDDLTCAFDSYLGVHRGQHLTIDQIRDTLGGLVRINE